MIYYGGKFVAIAIHATERDRNRQPLFLQT